MICLACHFVFEGGSARKEDAAAHDGVRRYKHHESFAAFMEAFDADCHFCYMLRTAYLNEHGQFPESIRSGQETFKITYLFETDVEWLGSERGDDVEKDELEEETETANDPIFDPETSTRSVKPEVADSDNSDEDSVVEEAAGYVKSVHILIVAFWFGTTRSFLKDFWLHPTGENTAYAFEEDSNRKALYIHTIEDSTGSESCRALMHEWVDYCVKHDPCPLPPSEKVHLPTRVIDVGKRGDAQVRLHISHDSAIQHGRYMTLSHRWGQVTLLKLTQSTLPLLQQGIPVLELSKTFRQAIEVTRSFEVRFPWIDSLCIFQDSAEDWRREAGNMGSVYHNCFLNLAATAAKDSDGGLFFTRLLRDVEHLEVEIDWLSAESAADQTSPPPTETNQSFDKQLVACECWDPDLWNFEIERAVVNTRGWVAQERLFSPRILHFGKNQLWCECRSRSACEMSPGGDPDFSAGSQLRPWKHLADCFNTTTPQLYSTMTKLEQSRRWRAWWDFVEAYSTRELTYPDDRLIAISAVAIAMIEQHAGRREDYLAGLFKWWLGQDLYWHVFYDERMPDAKKTFRPKAWRAPSWSWASIDGPVLRAQTGPGDQVLPLVRLVSAAISPMDGGNNITSQLNSASLILKCHVFEALWTLPSVSDFTRNGARLAPVVGDTTLTGHLNFDDFDLACTMAAAGKVRLRCILGSSVSGRSDDLMGEEFVYGLVVEADTDGTSQYRRIGQFVVNGSVADLCRSLGMGYLNDSGMMEITLF